MQLTEGPLDSKGRPLETGPRETRLQTEIQDLQRELRFLQEQLRETGHPALPLKIANIRRKLAELAGAKGKSNE